ncbi:MAG: carboxypeptidase regulatory-like domain-containing protein [Ignavibacteriales bacterium]|nr:MAG: carboxypeptidase regulatory-like domain-containing protein [Ignavibacteriales bacterium]
MRNKLYLFLSLFLFCVALSFVSCSDDGGTEPPPGGTSKSTTIAGVVLNETNQPVAGAVVSMPGQTDKTTDASGAFLFANITTTLDRFVVNVSKDGFFDGSVADAVKENGRSDVRVYLVTAGVTQTVDATSGGDAMLSNGSGVKLTGGTIANANGSDYTGNVNVSVAYLDPTSESFSNLIPGGDMQATTANNQSATLYSYGIIKVEMKSDAGADLQIKSGMQSEITVDIPPSMEGTAPATIPLWHYDKSTGLWKEEGTATKQGDKYVGMVGHFSDWNCDVPEGTATVRGLVLDCNNRPVPGIRVKIGQASATTGADGVFERRVPANTAFDVQVLPGNNFGLSSNPVAVPPLAEGTTHNVGTLTVPCPTYVFGMIACAGTPLFGQVVLSWDNGYNSQFTDANGKFRLATAPGKSGVLSVYTFDGRYTTVNVNTPAASGDSSDLGTIQVCDTVQVGDNEFTVNGGGLNNRTFVFAADTFQVYGYHLPSENLTYIWMVNVFGTDTVAFWATFTGTGTGTPTDIIMYFQHNSNYYIAGSSFPGTSVNLNITTYSGVGGLIEGTFGGTLLNFQNQQTVTISNGKFSVIRIVGQKNIDKKLIKRFPSEIRNNLK